MKRIIPFIVIVFLSFSVNAQWIENYGIRIGAGLSNQYWEYNDKFTGMSEWKDNKTSFAIYLNTESKINNFLSIRPEIGYIQKGFKEDITFITVDARWEYNNQKFILHYASANIGLLLHPFEARIKPFISIGLRGDYLVDYKDIKVLIWEIEYSYFKSYLEDYNKLVLGAFIGIGIDFNEKYYFEIEYNPAITNSVKYQIYSIKDYYLGVCFGVNINKLINR